MYLLNNGFIIFVPVPPFVCLQVLIYGNWSVRRRFMCVNSAAGLFQLKENMRATSIVAIFTENRIFVLFALNHLFIKKDLFDTCWLVMVRLVHSSLKWLVVFASSIGILGLPWLSLHAFFILSPLHFFLQQNLPDISSLKTKSAMKWRN